MAGETDDTKVDATTTAPSADKTNTPGTKDPGGNEPMIPKHRLDEEATKRQAAEARAEAAEKAAQDALASSKSVEKKMSDLAAALVGGDMSNKEANDEVAALAAKYDVKPDFFNDLLAAAEKRALKTVAPHIKQAQATSADAAFRDEFQKLADELPEVADLTTEEKAELKERAFKKEFVNTPLKSIYRDMMFDKPRGKTHTAETSRGGNRAPQDANTMPTFDMTTPEGIKAFENYSNNLGRRA